MESVNSEGIVFKKPTLENAKGGVARKRKLQSSSSGDAHDTITVDILRTFEGPSPTVSRRIELYSKHLKILKGHLERVHEKYNWELNEGLDMFIYNSFKMIEESRWLLPLGILESGLSVAENSAMFDYIQERIRASGVNRKTFVVRIQSGTNLTTKAVFQRICGQILHEKESDSTDEDSENSMTEVESARKDKNFSLYDLKSFLSSESPKYKIVILVEDVEYFPNAVITQLLTLMGCSGLPIIFVFGAIHGQYINNLVPMNSSTEFLIEKFYSVTPRKRLDDFMRRILFDCNNPFKISGSIAAYLESHYQEDNFSVDSLFYSIKYCLRQYFFSAKSAICSLTDTEEYSEDEMQCLNEIFTGDNDEFSPRKRQRNSKTSSGNVKEMISSVTGDIQAWSFCLRLFCFINFRLQDKPLGDTYTRVYTSFYTGFTNNENEAVAGFFRSLQSSSKTDIECILKDCLKFIQQRKNIPEIALVNSTISQFQQLEVDLEENDQNKESSEAVTKNGTLRLKRKNLTIRELQGTLLKDHREKQGTTGFHTVQKGLIDYLKGLLRKLAVSTKANSFLNIFVFDDTSQLINVMFPANFLQLKENMSNPGFALQCDCCSSVDAESIVDSLPDACIIHKLIATHTTKKVDLNLVYRQFLSVVEIQPLGRRPKASAIEAATASYLVRFRRAVGELQHMGFIKRTKSKPDEVTRLTWW